MRVLISLFCLIAGCSLNDPFPKFNTPYSDEGFDECLAQNPTLSRSECNIQNCLSGLDTLHGMSRLLKDIAPILEDMKLTYWLDGASVYGGIRFNAFVPWDDDVDVGVIASEFEHRTEELRSKLAALGYQLIPFYNSTGTAFRGLFGGQPDFWQVIMTKPVLDRIQLELDPSLSAEFLERSYFRYLSADLPPHLDIFVFDDLRDSLFMRVPGLKFPKNVILGPNGNETGHVTILDTSYSIPYNADQYASILLGKSISIKDDVVVKKEHASSACSNRIKFHNFSTSTTRQYLCSFLEFAFPSQGACP
ncbi:MAG: LicD family protein [Deltaproteobacteria bacterium]|nr:LicD family protein [Deltaproteobacteria bacterium]